MNSTLVVFASKQEFGLLFPNFSPVVASTTPVAVSSSFDAFVCGVGILESSVNLSYLLSQKKYKRVCVVGICGAYIDSGLNVLDVVRVDREVLGDMGVQNSDGHFIPWQKITPEKGEYGCDSPRFLSLALASLPSVSGATVNCCTGTSYLSKKRFELFGAEIETMEGASCVAVCKRFGIPVYEFRAVSNIASDRDPSQWRIEDAMAALKTRVLDNL